MAAVITGWEVRFHGSERVAEGTAAFRFGKPERFAFRPGQAIDLILPVPGAGEEAKHAFSIVSAPCEAHLVVATRMRDSAYKRALGALAPGARARIDGPFGALTLSRDAARDALLVAGGIGITPFMSILRQAAHDRLPQRLVLLYSNRRPEDAAFLAELRDLQGRNPGFRMVATMTDMAAARARWDGETGMVDVAMTKAALAGLANPVAYVAGPPAMVAWMRGVLEGAGLADDAIRCEDFFGY